MKTSQRAFSKAFLATAIASIACVPAVHAEDEFKLSEGLTITGFLDMSFTYADPEFGESVETSGVDQFEIDFLYDFGEGLTAQVDIEYQDDEASMEQAFLVYKASDEFSIKAGRFLSYSGWETEEPTGLYQFSGTGYGGLFYGGYQQGVSALYSTDTFDVALSLVNDLAGGADSDSSDEMATEFMLVVKPTEAITIKGFYMSDTDEVTGNDIDILNIWGSYSAGGLTLALEYGDGDYTTSEADGYLAMANYAWDKFGFTVRYHDYEIEAEGATFFENSALTLAPSIAVSSNLSLIFEYRLDEFTVDGVSVDVDTFAAEALLTF